MAMLMGNMSPQGKSFPTQQSMVGGPYSPYAGGMQTQTTTFPSSNSMVTSGNMAPNIGGSFVMSPLLSPQAAGSNGSMNMSFIPPTASGTQGSGIYTAGTMSPIGTLKAPGTMTAPGTLTAPSASPSRHPTGPIQTHHSFPGGGGAGREWVAAEDDCTREDECGGDDQGPSRTEYICGIDKKPLLPAGLVLSCVASGICLVLVQVQLLRRYNGIQGSVHLALLLSLVSLHAGTLILMFYCMNADSQTKSRKRGSQAEGESIPPRAHKTWLYDRPIRRFDHHCRWLLNSIALNNHRSFIVMLVGLTMIGIFSWFVDIWVFVTAFNDNLWIEIPLKLFAVALHFVYATGVLYLVIPIIGIHATLISRSELAKDVTKDTYRVLQREGLEDVPVLQLDSEAYQQALDEDRQFEYSAELNPYDKGMVINCTNFWCASRSENQKGDF